MNRKSTSIASAERHGQDEKDWPTRFVMKQNRGIWLAFSNSLVKKSKCWKTNRTISRRHGPSPVKNPDGSRAHPAGDVLVAAPGAAAECVVTTVVARSEAMAATAREVNVAAIGLAANVAATGETTTVTRTTAQIDLGRKATAPTALQAAALHNTTTAVESNKVVRMLRIVKVLDDGPNDEMTDPELAQLRSLSAFIHASGAGAAALTSADTPAS
jgi:hypothetical protein